MTTHGQTIVSLGITQFRAKSLSLHAASKNQQWEKIKSVILQIELRDLV